MDLKKKSVILILLFLSIIIIAASAQLVVPRIQTPGMSPMGSAVVNSPSVTTPVILNSQNSAIEVSTTKAQEISSTPTVAFKNPQWYLTHGNNAKISSSTTTIAYWYWGSFITIPKDTSIWVLLPMNMPSKTDTHNYAARYASLKYKVNPGVKIDQIDVCFGETIKTFPVDLASTTWQNYIVNLGGYVPISGGNAISVNAHIVNSDTSSSKSCYLMSAGAKIYHD